MLTLNNIIPLNGCINCCKDLEGNIYKIPNFCINNPYIEKELIKEITGKENKELKVILHSLLYFIIIYITNSNFRLY